MSRTIDERVVEMRFDNKQFENNVQTSLSSIDKLKQSLNLSGASKGLENVNSAAKNCNMSGLSGAVETVRLKFSALEVMAVTALANITNSAINAGKKIVSSLTIDPIKTGFQEYETQINAVQTILANTSSKGTTLQQVNAALEELNKYADMTIYNFTEMTRNIGTFTAAGVDLDTSVSAIKGIANLAAVSGSNSQQASTAMYQLSQALSAGTVKLQDWNSVVNAGMGGQVFQDALKDTARVHGVAIDKMIKDEGSFRETLSEGWLTSEILTETLAKFTGDLNENQLRTMGYSEEQIASIIKMGQTANDAATKVKTFTQLFDTLKEAAQSGWTQSWQIIVGDFEEAKSLLTEMSNTIGDIINESAERRNELLSKGLSSGWKQLLKEGIADEEGYKESIIAVAKERGIAIEKMIEDSGSFEDTLKDGWLTADILSESISNLTAKTEGLSDEQLNELGYTRSQIESLESLNESVKNGSVSLDEFAEKMQKASGRENLIQALWNAFNGLLSVVKPIKEAFSEIFPPMTGDQLYNLTVKIKDLTEKFKLGEETSKNLKSTFKGVFAVLDIGVQAFKAVAGGVADLISFFAPAGSGILGLTGRFGEYLVKLDDTIKKTDLFRTAVGKVVDFIKTGVTKAIEILEGAGKAVKEFGCFLKEKFNFPGFEIFHVFLERVHARMTQVGDAASDMKSVVVVAIEAMGDALANSKFLQALQALWEGVKTIASGIVKALGDLTGGLIDKLSNADFSGILDFISGASLGAIAITISKFLDSVTEPLQGLQGLLDGLTGILDGVRGSFEAYQTQLKAGTLLKIASAIAILTASIVAISLIDSDKLSASLGAITVLFADLMGSMSIFTRISDTTGRTMKACAAMIAMAAAVSILAGAMKKIADLDWEGVAKGLVGVTGLSAIVVASTKVMSSGSGQLVKGATSLVIFAAAIKVLASVCTDLSVLDWDELGKGLVGVGVLLGEVAIFLNVAKFSGKMMSTATGIVILAAAMKILASACKDFGNMEWEEIGKGLTGIGILLAEIALFTNLTGNAKHVISTGVALIAIGAAMKIFASAVSNFAAMQWDQIGRGLTAMGIALAEVAIAVNVMPKNMISIGTGLVVVSAALLIMAEALDRMSDMTWNEIARGLTALGGSMAIMALGLNAMNGTLAGSAAMLVAAGALAVLTPVLSILGAMSWESIAKGLITIAGAFAILGVAGAVLTPLVPTIVGLGAAFTLIGIGVLGVGAGLLAAGAGLSALAVGFTALAAAGVAGATAIVASLAVIITGVADLIPVVLRKIGEGILALCDVIVDGAPAIGEAVKAIILSIVDVLVECVPAIADGALELIAGVLEALVKHTPKIVDSLLQFLIKVLEGIARNLPALIKAAIDVLMKFFSGIVDALSGIDTDILLKGIVGIGILSAIMLALSAVASLVPGAMAGVLGMGVVIAELALVLAAIGLLAQIPGLSWLIGEGEKLLEGIGVAIGSFIGGIVGGFMSGVSSQFPQIGADLSAFMTNIQPFIEGAAKIDSSMMDGVKALAETILILTAANILEGLTSWFTGGSSMTKFSQELVPFGVAMKDFSIAVAGMDRNLVANAATAGKTLAEMAAIIPKCGGVVGFFTGENDMSAFGQQLVPFGKAMKEFSLVIIGLDGDAVANAAIAGKAMAEMAATLPNSGGVVGFFTGENDMAAFGQQLVPFGKAIKEFAFEVQGLDADAVTNSATAGKALVELAKTVPNSGGVVGFFTGENDMDAFANQIVPFGKAMKEYATSVSGIDSGAITNSTTAGKALVELASTLPNTGGLVSWFTGDNDIAAFGQKLVSFGESFASYYVSVSTVNCSQLSNVIAEFKKLVDLANGISSIDTSSMSTFSKNLTALGNSGIDSFINAFTNASSRVTTAATTMLTTFISGANSKQSELTSTFTTLVQAVLTAINNNQPSFQTAGQTLMVKFVAGVKAQDVSARTTFTNIISGCLTAIKNKYAEFTLTGQECMVKIISGVKSKDAAVKAAFIASLGSAVTGIKEHYNQFYEAGKYLVEGFAKAITDNTLMAEARSRAMAAAAARAAEDELDINSPSRVGYGIGNFFGLGFVNAMGDYVSRSYKAGAEMAASARNGLSEAASKISDLIDGNIDTQPTIRPVLDLSDLQNGARSINGMFGTKSLHLARIVNSGSMEQMTASEKAVNNNADVVKAISELQRDVIVLGDKISKMNIVMDSGALVGQLVNPLDTALGNIPLRDMK